MKIPSFKWVFILWLISAGMGMSAHASEPFVDPYADYDEAAAFDMELEENLATPVVQKAERPAVVRYMKALAQNLGKRYRVELLRAGEVAVVTIPASELFLPNDTLLSQDAPQVLKPLMSVFHDPEMFKLVYCVHTDNTGSEQYIEDLCSARNQSIYAYLTDVAKLDSDQFIINYDMGDSSPLYDNDTRNHRAANRRVEFFIVPGPKLITMAHRKKIK